ncbi:MAG: Gfo/Idh/MocA family oxidoreductase [Armatimonadota bacterium]|nr:Gfo/Idh/MocA family oxidoreductase [Armatimonadota bacterium]
MPRRITRRDFLKSTAISGASFLFLRDSRLAFGYRENEKLNIAIIGSGGKGGDNLNNVASENIVALCDIDETHIPADRFPKAKVYYDFRRLLDEMEKQIDAVVVSTPDHTHAHASIMAMRMGKHVYCEKPLTHSIYEARLMRETARKYKVATQMGNQGTASTALREGVEIIQAGAIGPVREVHVWSNRPIWPQGINRPTETPPVPKEIHWDLFLGPAPKRPYHPCYHPFKWRGWIDFGTGALGDMGCHTLNMVYMALKLDNPISVEAEVINEMTSESYPKQSIIRYTFPARNNMPPLRLKWYDGGLKPSPSIIGKDELPGSGVVLIGDNGIMYSPGDGGGACELLPAEKFENYQKPQPTLPRSPGHHAEWIRACKGGEPAMSNFNYAAGLTELCLLGNLALLTREPIYWDSKNMRAINCPKADRFINTPYRKGWEL